MTIEIKNLTTSTPKGTRVGFKDDVEQYGTLRGFDDWGFAVISVWDSVVGERYTVTVPVSSCWIEVEAEAPAAHKPSCSEIREAAAAWNGTRKEFIEAMVARGANKATVATQWNKGRK